MDSFSFSRSPKLQSSLTNSSYLRNGNIYLPDERIFLMNLRLEAEYYQLMGLTRIIDRALGWGRGKDEEDPSQKKEDWRRALEFVK